MIVCLLKRGSVLIALGFGSRQISYSAKARLNQEPRTFGPSNANRQLRRRLSNTQPHIVQTVAMPLSPLTTFILRRPWLSRWMIPLSKWYATKMGYRQLGLKYEDLLPEETPAMQLALKRLPPKEAYDRVFRLRRAFQVCLR